MIRSATFSDCRTYRYTLERIWDKSKSLVMFIGLNPSTANELTDDNTIRRCINYCKIWGYGGLIMTNLFAFRTRHPSVMIACSDPVGPKNDYWLNKTAKRVDLIVAAWGNDGQKFGRTNKVHSFLKKYKISYLKFTSCRQPAHPLFLKKSLKPMYLETGKLVDIPGSNENQIEMFGK